MGEHLEMTATLLNERVQFSAACGDNPPVTMDYRAPLGDDAGYTPLELLLMSLAGCSGATVGTLLRRMHRRVTGMEVRAAGVRRDEHPTCFSEITLHFTIHSPDCPDGDALRALRLSEETYCPVWAMVKGSVPIRAEFQIVGPCGEAGEA